MRASFPSDFLSLNEKKSKQYILQYAKAMFEDFGSWNQHEKVRKKYQRLRLWSEGMQDISYLKPYLDVNAEEDFSNINFTPIAEGKEYVNQMVNHLCNSEYELQVNAVDALSKTKKDKFIADKKAEMLTAKLREELTKQLGVPLQQEPQFKTKEELDRYLELNYKQGTELAMELILQHISNESSYSDYLKRKIYKDLVVLKHATVRVYNEPSGLTKLRYVDPENLIFSSSNDDRMKDLSYIGEVRFFRLGQIIEMAGNEFTPEEYRDIANEVAGKHSNPLWERAWNTSHLSCDSYALPYYDFLVPVLDFEFLSTTYNKFEAKTNKFGNRRVYDKKIDYKQTEFSKPDSTLHTDKREYRFEGKWIIGTDYIFEYGLADNIARENDKGTYSKSATLTYINIRPDVYKGENKSKMEVMIPFLEQMQLAFYRIQQIITTHIPNAFAIDMFGLQGLSVGKGGEESSPTEIVEFFRKTGYLPYTSRPDGQTPTQTPPITPFPKEILSDLQAEIQIYEYNKQRVQSVTGWNEAMNGTKVDKDALVGVQKMQANNAQNSIKDLFYAYKDLTKRAFYQASLCIQHGIRFSNVIEEYNNVIGSDSVNILKEGKDIPLCKFGISIEYLPAEEERMALLEALQISLQAQTIKPSDYIKIRDIKNTKMAYVYLSDAEKKYSEEKQQSAMQNIQANSEANNQSAMLKIQADEKKIMTEIQAKSQLLQMEAEINMAMEQLKFENERELLQMRLEMQRMISTDRNETQKEIATIYDDNFNLNTDSTNIPSSLR